MKFLATIGFILAANCLLCWLFTSDYWFFDPILGLILFTAGIVVIGLLGFRSIEDRSNGF